MIQLIETPHYFIAIKLSDAMKHHLFNQQVMIKQCLGEGAYKTWTNHADFHITLAFLGALTDAELVKAKTCLTNLETTASFDVRLTSLAGFGKQQSPRVLIHQVALSEALSGLHQRLKESLQAAQFRVEKRDFHPHVTYAKKCQKNYQLAELADQIKAKHTSFSDPLIEPVTELSLYRIHPGADPQYQSVMTILLK